MKRIILFSVVILLTSFASNAQDRKESLERDGFYTRETTPARVPIPYQFVRESDVLWSKRIWRIIDLKQKMNYPLYYPTILMQDRESLLQRLVRAIKYNEINAYDPIDDEFTTRLSYEQVLKNLGALDDSVPEYDEYGQQIYENGKPKMRFKKGEISWKEVTQLLVKEDWFFDKQRSVLEVRIIGICPVMFVYQGDQKFPKQIFWIYFPEARGILANTDVFNNFNDAQRISFDDLFWKRNFDSYIIKESNVWDNRRISDYTFIGVQTLLESERIKRELFNFEHDLWEY